MSSAETADGRRTLEPGRSIGPYRVLDELGRGGMGTVYRCAAPDGSTVAVKILRHASLLGTTAGERFAREARVRVSSPHIAKVLDAGTDAEIPWVAFEHLDGETLAEALLRGPLSPVRARAIALQICRGLADAHAAGIVHRDVKPSNVIVTREGVAKLIDFGIARFADAEVRLTATGNLLGTPTHIAPEQAGGSAAVGARADVWAVGMLLYESLTGRVPFLRPTTLATVLAIMVEEAPPPSIYAAGISPSFEGLIRHCLQKDPLRRHADAGALLEALQAIEPGSDHAPAGADRPDFAATMDLDQTQLREGTTRPTIPPGEERIVAILLAQEILDREALEAAVCAVGGMLLLLADDRAIGLFGAVTWEGNEAERAASAAVRARESARWMSVASGRASSSGQTGIAGSALDVAVRGIRARLEGIALDAQTARQLPASFSIRGQGQALELLGRASIAPPTLMQPELAPLTAGRGQELALLEGAAREVIVEGRGRAILLLGPSGIGKTHLARCVAGMLVEHASPPRLLVGRASAEPQRRAFALWRSLLGGYALGVSEREGGSRIGGSAPMDERRQALLELLSQSLAPDEISELAPFLADLFDLEWPETAALSAARSDARLMRDRLREGVETWLLALAEQLPTVIILDDLHWADEESLDLLEDLLPIFTGSAVLVLGTARPGVLEARPQLFDGAGTEVLKLRELDREAVGTLASSVLGRPLDVATVGRLSARTGGNPLFVEQISRALLEETDGAGGDAGDSFESLPLPLDVEAAIQSRLDHLPPAEKALCKSAAIFGGEFSAARLRALDIPEAEPLLRSLLRRELLISRPMPRSRGGRCYSFRSQVFADVAYRMISETLRRDLHRRVAMLLSAEPSAEPDELAHHYEQAGEPALAADYYAEASMEALHGGDPHRLLGASAAALRLGIEARERSALLLGRAEAFELLGQLEAQGKALEAALEAAADQPSEPSLLARLLTARSVWLSRIGRREEALEVAREAVRVARTVGDVAILARARGRQGAIFTFAGQLEEARQAIDEARSLVIAGAPELAPLSAVWAAQLASAEGDLGGRREAFEAAVAGYEAIGDLRGASGAAMNLADVKNRLGAYAEAEAALRKALLSLRKLGSRLMEGYALANLGYSLTMQGRAREALEVLGQGLELAEGLGEQRLMAWLRLYRLRAASSLEASSEQRGEQLEEGRSLASFAPEGGDEDLQIAALVLASRAALALEASGLAALLSEQALALRDARGGIEEDEAELFLTRAEALEASGDPSGAAAIRARGRERLEQLAAKIREPSLRAAFEQDVLAHREMLRGSEGS